MSVARRTGRRVRSAVVCGTLLAAAALSLPLAQTAAARPYDPPPPRPVPLAELLTQLQTLYRQTEAATESYKTAKVSADRLRTEAKAVDGRLADQRVALAASREQAGAIARRMYRDGGVSPYLSVLGGQSPQDFFGQRHVLARAAGHQRDLINDLASGEERLARLNTQSQATLDRAQQAQSLQAAEKSRVETRLREVEAMLAGLTGLQLEQLQALEEEGVNKAQQEFLDSKALGADPALRAPSAAGDRAIAYAFAQLGKPYVWGAEGPDAFDCSGLTSQAWAHAGTRIARTSEQQWATLPHVPMSLLRPGDLVLYFPGATHVALYIGNGLVVQAPRPGSFVKVSPIAANPVLGAVRPDSGERPLSGYQDRPVPAQARKPTPIAAPPPAPQRPAPRPPAVHPTRPPVLPPPVPTSRPTPRPTGPVPPTAPVPTATPTATSTGPVPSTTPAGPGPTG